MEGIWLVVYRNTPWIKGCDVYLEHIGSTVSSIADAKRFPTEELAWQGAIDWPLADEHHLPATVVRAKVTTTLKVEGIA